MTTANGNVLSCSGTGIFQLKVEDISVQHKVWVADISIDGILRLDFLSQNECSLDLAKGEVFFHELPHSPYTADQEDIKCLQIAVCKEKSISPETKVLSNVSFSISQRKLLMEFWNRHTSF